MQEQAKILLVDDDPDFVEATKAVLESKYQVITAEAEDYIQKPVTLEELLRRAEELLK